MDLSCSTFEITIFGIIIAAVDLWSHGFQSRTSFNGPHCIFLFFHRIRGTSIGPVFSYVWQFVFVVGGFLCTEGSSLSTPWLYILAAHGFAIHFLSFPCYHGCAPPFTASLSRSRINWSAMMPSNAHISIVVAMAYLFSKYSSSLYDSEWIWRAEAVRSEDILGLYATMLGSLDISERFQIFLNTLVKIVGVKLTNDKTPVLFTCTTSIPFSRYEPSRTLFLTIECWYLSVGDESIDKCSNSAGFVHSGLAAPLEPLLHVAFPRTWDGMPTFATR